VLGTSAATESKAEAHYTTPHTTDRSSPSTARPPVPIDASLSRDFLLCSVGNIRA
jgi:hypothetical protein